MGNESYVGQEHEGDRYLRLLGLEHLGGNKIETGSGTILVRDFLDVCGDYARPVLAGFETMSPDDPRYEDTRNTLRSLIGKYIEGDNPANNSH
jgi:hypothetical protein